MKRTSLTAMRNRALSVLAAIVCTVPQARALAAVDTGSQWHGKGELGLIFARGNADTDSASSRIELGWEDASWDFDLGLDALRARASDVTAAHRFEARFQAAHEISGPGYWFGAMRYSDDRFTGFDYRASASTGYRHQFIELESTSMSAQIGTGYRLDNSLALANDADLIGLAEMNFEHGLTQTAHVLNRLTSESDGRNTYVENRLALEVRINAALALSIGANLRYNSDPPPQLRTTDTLTTLNLVYAFKQAVPHR